MTQAGPFEVRFSDHALLDLNRLFDYLLDRAENLEDLELAQRAVDEISSTCVQSLSRTPFSFRKSGGSALRRELIIAFGSSGYVAQYAILPSVSKVIVLAVRHQLEQDYH
jgi:plasmid stabilization system protein ParE